MKPWLHSGGWGALIGRLADGVADPVASSMLQDRLARHGAELSGQVPELLLRAPDPERALRSWLADKELSHWIPQADGGTAAQGWQFETAGWRPVPGGRGDGPGGDGPGPISTVDSTHWRPRGCLRPWPSRA